MELLDLDNPDQTRVLAWTNARVDAINQAIRQHFHGLKVPSFLVGDKVVTTDVVKDPEGNDILLARWMKTARSQPCMKILWDGAAGSGTDVPLVDVGAQTVTWWSSGRSGTGHQAGTQSRVGVPPCRRGQACQDQPQLDGVLVLA